MARYRFFKITAFASLMCFTLWAEKPEEFAQWINEAVKTVINIAEFEVSVSQPAVLAQGELFGPGRSFKEAFVLALLSFATDASDEESALALAQELCLSDTGVACPLGKLRDPLQQKGSTLTMIEASNLPAIFLPRGERLLENWLFELKIPALSDHSFYAVVPRESLKIPYNYGFN